ncbi:hypothetical protein G7046_g5269 [Stylonectria norvegica]|nr:hypothetical protein G7046_g5269 [Stylonectria norvegica]
MAGRQQTSQSTYYDRRLRQGPALIRARRPYLFKNSITGLGLLGVVGGICTRNGIAFAAVHSTDIALDYYTITAVGQDDFDDVKVPDNPERPTGISLKYPTKPSTPST